MRNDLNLLTRRHQEKWLAPTFVAILVFLSGIYAFLYFNTRGLQEKTVEVSESFRVMNELDLLLSAVKDAESSQRGFIVTGEPQYLTPFNAAIGRIDSREKSLKQLIADRPDLQPRLETYERLVAERLKLLHKRIETFTAEGQAAAIDEYKSGLGMQAMERLKAFHDDFREDERQNHARYLEEYNSRSDLVGAIYLVAGIVTFLAILTAFIVVARILRRQEEDRWIKAMVAHMARLIGGDLDSKEIGAKVNTFFAEHFGSLVSNFYVCAAGTAQLTASFAGRGDAAGPALLREGEGLAGEVLRQKTLKVVSDVPPGYLPVTSSVGSSDPREIIVVPFMFEDQVTGILEFGVLEKVPRIRMALISALSETIGIYLNSALNRLELQSLLRGSQEQARELAEQKTRLIESNDKLEIQTAELTAAKEKLQIQQEELRQSNEELEQQALALEQQKKHLSNSNQELLGIKKALEEKANELILSSKYKSEFLANMSHELRTPLNSMLILATLLIENKEENLSSQQIDFVKTIHTAGSDLLNVINDILDLSKVEAGKLDLNPEWFSVDAAMKEVTAMFEPQASAKDIELNVIVEDGAPEKILSDRHRLGQILKNFISNAIKFTDKGAVTVRVRTLKDDELEPWTTNQSHFAIDIEDTGMGIPDDMKSRIFEAFQQVDGSTSRKHGGTGLGLAISRELSSLLGASIRVASVEGEGSVFTLVTPVEIEYDPEAESTEDQIAGTKDRIAERVAVTAHKSPKPDQQRAGASRTESGGRGAVELGQPAPIFEETIVAAGRSILIVEDDRKFARVVSMVAEQHGFNPVHAQDAEKALELIKSHKPCAIILDVKLPGMSGISLLEKLKQNPRTRHIPIHVVSGHDCLPNALRIGAAGFLAKPASKEELGEAFSRIETIISRSCKKVLVVEDDRIQREGICHLISGDDIEIIPAEKGSEALELLRNEVFDCMILDLKLPDMTGFELLSKMDSEESVSRPPVIVYTGRDLEKDEEFRLRKYSDSIVLKGARSPERLLDEVTLFLHRVETDLPVDKQTMLKKIRKQGAAFAGQKVLIVDDDVRNIFALMSALESHGLNVAVGRNGYEAIEYLKTDPDVDLVLMDIMMPKMDGFEAMSYIRKEMANTKLPIIALTAKAMKGDSEKCINAGASDYLPKPVDLSRLMSLLNAWLPTELVN